MPPSEELGRSKTLSELLASKKINRKQLSDFEIWKKSVSAESQNKMLMDEYSKTYTRNLDGAVDFKIDNSETAYIDDLLRLAYIKERQGVLKDQPPPTVESTASWYQTWKDANLNKDFEYTSMEVLRDDFDRWKPSTQDNITPQQAEDVKNYIVDQHESIREELTQRVVERQWWQLYLDGLRRNKLTWKHYMGLACTAAEAYMFYKIDPKTLLDKVAGPMFMVPTFAFPFLDNKAAQVVSDADYFGIIPDFVVYNVTYLVPPILLAGYALWVLKGKK